MDNVWMAQMDRFQTHFPTIITFGIKDRIFEKNGASTMKVNNQKTRVFRSESHQLICSYGIDCVA